MSDQFQPGTESDDPEIASDWVITERRFRDRFRIEWQLEPDRFYPYFRPCRNRVLMVADGGLDFSEDDFGMSVFVRTLLLTPGFHVRHEITLAHIDPAGPDRLMWRESRIARRISQFRFDDPSHFTPDMYDVVMLFGIRQEYFGRAPASDGIEYTDRLAPTEIDALTAFMNGGGGLFATGDHGLLGWSLGSAVPRVRNMRLWDHTSVPEDDWDEVSMGGPRRNDTNRGTLFDNQSDDIPQIIAPRMYVGGWIFPVRYPHPLLCGPNGVITVMPDHPHEGECQAPPDVSLMLADGTEEYPPALDGGPRPLPEVISTNSVPAGNTASMGFEKDATHAQAFGGISAYDGHRAGVGRTVTDATWHHFVNTNLIGMVSPSAPAFDLGFFSSPQGIVHLEQIRAYYRNLATWLARRDQIRCMNLRFALFAVYDGKVLEAVLTGTSPEFDRISPRSLRLIGAHARDVLGRAASRCQVLGFVQDVVLERAVPELVPEVDPWRPRGPKEPVVERSQWVDASGLVDIALGGALVELRRAIGEPTEKEGDVDAEAISEVLAEGGRRAFDVARQSIAADLERARGLFPG